MSAAILMNDDYRAATREYAQLMQAYVDALREKDPVSRARLGDAALVWERICSFGGTESEDPYMHLVIALCTALEADAPAEAKRLYEEMPPVCQRKVDIADTRYDDSPGSMKIWLRR